MINTDFLHSVQNGDEDAIQSLIRAHQRQVFQLALSILDTTKNDSADAARQAEIATRETFMSAIARIGRYHEDSNFNTWLYGIAIQVARRRYRRWQVIRGLRRLWSRRPRRTAPDSFYSAKKLVSDSASGSPSASAATAAAAATGASAATAASAPMPRPVESVPAPTTDAVMWDAVRGLDERLRLPVVLRYYHDFPIAEIAALLKTSEGSVHARLDKARDKLAGK